MRCSISPRAVRHWLDLDNLKVHHALIVKQWLALHAEHIEVFYLPSYSPELNPDDCPNADLKAAVTTQAPARSKGQLRKAAISHMRKLQKSPARIRKCFQHKPVRYAARCKWIMAGSITGRDAHAQR